MERKGETMKDCQQDISPCNDQWIPVQSRQSSATVRRQTFLEENQIISLGRPVFNLSNCHENSDNFIHIDEESIDFHKWKNGKQTNSRGQEKHGRRKFEHVDTDSKKRGETKSKSLNGNQILCEDQRRLYENEIRLTKEIHKKEILLQEKLLKAADTLRKFQLRKEARGNVESEEQYKREKEENILFKKKKENLDCLRPRDRALGRRRHDQKDGFDNWFRAKDDVERLENHVKGKNASQKETRQEGIQWKNGERNTPRTTKTMEKEKDQIEEMTKHRWKISRTEKDKTKRESAIEWQVNEIREWDQRDRQEKQIVRIMNGEKRRHQQIKFKRDMEINIKAQNWDLMDTFGSNSHKKGNANSKQDKKNLLIEDHFGTQEHAHQTSNKAEVVMPLKNSLSEVATNALNSKRQVQLSLESNPDNNAQLIPCKVCNRQFTEDRLEKHIIICQKIQKTTRHVYDSSRYRAKGTELEEFLKTTAPSKSPELKKSNWRQKHEAFLQNLRQARAPGFQPSVDLYSHYVTCSHCNRRFAPGPAERHIPKCKDIKSRPPPPRQRH